jgi:enamine deaminase RidA (YjgF/YER057c/UK114 family)
VALCRADGLFIPACRIMWFATLDGGCSIPRTDSFMARYKEVLDVRPNRFPRSPVHQPARVGKSAGIFANRGGQSSRLIFLAGQAARDVRGEVVGDGDLEAQAEQAFKNISIALASVGCTAAHLVKLTVFMRDMSKLPDYRRARDRFLNSVEPPAAPAITLVEVSRLFAEGLMIEIEGIAAA